MHTRNLIVLSDTILNVSLSFLLCLTLSLSLLLTQVVEDGYEFFAKRKLVTLFSAPNYCNEYDNAGGMMKVDEQLFCSFQVGICSLPPPPLSPHLLSLPPPSLSPLPPYFCDAICNKKTFLPDYKTKILVLWTELRPDHHSR